MPGTPRFGVHQDLLYNSSASSRAQVIARTTELLHPSVSRNSLLWDRIEPEPGHYDWEAADEIVDDLVAAHVQPLLVLVGSPPWANGAGAEPDHQFYVPAGTAFGKWLAHFRDFAATAARRYRGRVRWEVWNEPNEAVFWKPAPDVSEFAALYQAVRSAIHAADPGAEVASGGVNSLTRTDRAGFAGLDFLGKLLEAGMRPDAVAIHPYTSREMGPLQHLAGENNFDDIALVHDLLAARGAGATPLWVTEWGWSSATVGPDRQAEFIRQSLELFNDHFAYVRVAIVFVDYDRPRFKEGLLDADLQPKPAATAFVDAAATVKAAA